MEKWYPLNIAYWQTEITYKRQRWSYCFNIEVYELLCPASVLGKYWILSEIALGFTTWKEIWRWFNGTSKGKLTENMFKQPLLHQLLMASIICYIERKSLCGVCSASATLCAEEPTVIKQPMSLGQRWSFVGWVCWFSTDSTERFSPGTPVSPLLKNHHLPWFVLIVNFSWKSPQLVFQG